MSAAETQKPPGSIRQVAGMRTAEDRLGIQTAWERLFVAVNYLAAGSGTLQFRLDCAYVRCIVPLLRADLSEDFRAELDQIIAILAGTDIHVNEKAVRESISRLTEPDAKEAAGRIVSLFNFAARSHPLRA